MNRGKRWLEYLLGKYDPAIPGLLAQVLSPASHAPLFRLYRARFVISRVRIVAAVFALLTPLWFGADVAVFTRAIYVRLLLARLLTSAAFVGLAVSGRDRTSLGSAYRMVALLYVIPSAFYLYAQYILYGADLTTVGAAVAMGYLFLPFALVAGLSIFPLTLAELVGLAFPLIGIATVPMLGLPGLDGAMVLWLLLMVVTISAVASLSQLQLMHELYQESAFDSLTGVYNRRSGQEFLAQQFDLARRYGFPLSLVFVDLDDFKRLNDIRGHDAGDVALRETARILRSNLRTSDILIRWGGEEFLQVLPHTDIDEAQRQLVRLCQGGICRLCVQPSGAGTALTFSAGIAELVRDRIPVSQDWRALLALADRRMYQAKIRGKARIVAGDTDGPPSVGLSVRGGPGD